MMNTPVYDVFISHAVEDKIPVVNELCFRLEKSGVRVLYSGNEFSIGDSFEQAINKGLIQASYGVIVITPSYLTKIKSKTALSAEADNLLPLLHGITSNDLMNNGVTIKGKSVVTTEQGLSDAIDCLIRKIRNGRHIVKDQPVRTINYKLIIGAAIISTAVLLIYWLFIHIF